MCVIETRTYIYPNGAHYTSQIPRLCPESNGARPCRYTTTEQTEQHVDGVPPLSPSAGSPVSQNFPPTPTSFANVELRQPTSSEERRSSKWEQDRKVEKRYVIKPELVIKIGSNKKRDKEKEKHHRHRSSGSISTSNSSEVIYVGSPSRRDAPIVVVPDPSSTPPVAPNYNTTIHEPSGYNTTYVQPTPPPPPPAPRRPGEERDISPPPSPSARRKHRRPTMVTIHHVPGPAAPASSSSSEPTPTMIPGPSRQRRASMAATPMDDNEFFARQAERERARAEARRIEQERQQLAEEAYHAQLELDRADARERARKEERGRRRHQDREDDFHRRRSEEEAVEREAGRAADRERRRKGTDEARPAAEVPRRGTDRERERDRDAGRGRRSKREEEKRPQRADMRRTQERAEALARERALEQTTEQMARERAAAAARAEEDAASEEASRRYWSPRTGMEQRLRSERRHISGNVGGASSSSQPVRPVEPRQPDEGAAIPPLSRRSETTRERGERVLAQARAQERTREMIERFGEVTVEDGGEPVMSGALPRRRRTVHAGGKEPGAGYSSDVDGGKRRRRRYFD